jgi:hypothetical protein
MRRCSKLLTLSYHWDSMTDQEPGRCYFAVARFGCMQLPMIGWQSIDTLRG